MNYTPADKSFIVNDGDVDLRPIRISLPDPPTKHSLIDGYGLDPKDQRFCRLEIPPKLDRLEKNSRKVTDERGKHKGAQYAPTKLRLQKEFWESMLKDKDFYKDEIDFIKKYWWHRLYGYWFYNHGKPTYITGWHFVYLNFWYMPDVRPDGYPHYRDRDRKEFLFHQYAYTCSETFENLDKSGWAVPNLDGTYDMKDTDGRISYGVIQPKNRRSGNTNKGLSIIHEIVSRTHGTDGAGIMSYTGDNAEAHFKQKLVIAWNKMPVWTLPLTTSPGSPTKIVYNVPGNEFNLIGLKNTISYAETGSSTFYDGKKLIACLPDESGKTETQDVDLRWQVLKNCLAQGNGALIHGYSYHPSTVEEYSKGGDAYQSMANKSSFYQREKVSDQTSSGLFRIFMPADEGLDKYIDSYGMSVIGDEPLPYQKEEGFTKTATRYLAGKRQEQLDRDTPESLSEYRAQRRLFPLRWADCWMGESGEIGFPTEKLTARIHELRKKSQTMPGNFEWENGFGSQVVWREDPHNGRYETSRLFLELANKRMRDIVWDPINMVDKETWAPMQPDRGTIGGDPFKFKSRQEIRKSYQKYGMSDGGIFALWEYDASLDGDNPRSEWESDDVICTYRYRPKTDDEFVEDILKCAIWYGYMVYPENNLTIIEKKFREWGYEGYLKYDIGPDGNMKQEPGTNLHTRNKQEGFTMMRNFLEYRCHKIKHINFLQECLDITNVEDLTNRDLLASGMVALLGSRSQYAKVMQRMNTIKVDASMFVQKYDY